MKHHISKFCCKSSSCIINLGICCTILCNVNKIPIVVLATFLANTSRNFCKTFFVLKLDPKYSNLGGNNNDRELEDAEEVGDQLLR